MDRELEDRRPGFAARMSGHLRDLGRALFAGLRGASARARGVAARRWNDPRLRRRVIVLGRDLAAAMLLAALVLGASALCFVRIEPGTLGVRQVNWGAEREIGARDLAPGLYFGPRPFYSWHHLDARTQVLSFAPETHGGDHPLLELRSASGTTVQVAVTVPYRIRSGEAHAIVQDGLKLAWPMRVKSTVEKVLVQELSKFDADGFADPQRRRAVAAVALERLNRELSPHHVSAEGVYVRGFQYAPTYEKKKREEQLASQTLETNRVLAQLKDQRLDKDFLAQRLGEERDVLIADAKRELQAEEARWQNQLVEDQKIANQFLELELQRQKREVVTQLAQEFEQARRDERERPLAQRTMEKLARSQRAERLEAARVAELARELEQARQAARQEVDAERARNELSQAELRRAEEALAAELELANGRAEIELKRELQDIEGEARFAAAAVRREADAAFAELAGQGERALAAARTQRDRLEAEALAHPGARFVLAREAATNLRLERVSLDSNDPRVPTVLDLDALVALLLGGASASR